MTTKKFIFSLALSLSSVALLGTQVFSDHLSLVRCVKPCRKSEEPFVVRLAYSMWAPNIKKGQIHNLHRALFAVHNGPFCECVPMLVMVSSVRCWKM